MLPFVQRFVSKARFSGSLKKLRVYSRLSGWRAFWCLLQFRLAYSKIIRKKKLVFTKKNSGQWWDVNLKDVSGLILSRNLDLYNFKKNLRARIDSKTKIKSFFRF